MEAEQWEAEKPSKMIFELQPDIIVNDRGALPGDFSTPEQKSKPSEEEASMRGKRIAIAVLPAARWICLALLCPWMAAGGARPDGLLFRASLDRALAADFAAGDSRPLVSQDVHLADSAAAIPRTAVLAYDAHANLYAEQGSLSFWWRPGESPDPVGFPVFMSFYEQDSTWSCDFLRVNWDGRRLVARLRDRNLTFYNAEGPAARPPAGRWLHIAVTWGESAGLTL